MNTAKHRFHDMLALRIISPFRWREAIHGLTFNAAKGEFAAAVHWIIESGDEDRLIHHLWGYVKIISNRTKFAFGWSPTLYHDSIEAEKGAFVDRCTERILDTDDFIEWAWRLLVMAYTVMDRSDSSLAGTWSN